MPKVLDKLADYLAQQRCSRTEGIFRVPAQADKLKSYTEMIDKGGLPDFLTNGNPPVALTVVCAIRRCWWIVGGQHVLVIEPLPDSFSYVIFRLAD